MAQVIGLFDDRFAADAPHRRVIASHWSSQKDAGAAEPSSQKAATMGGT